MNGKVNFIPDDISEIKDKKPVDLSFLSPRMNDGIKYTNLVMQVDTNRNEVSISSPITKSEWDSQAFLISGYLPENYVNETSSLGNNKYGLFVLGKIIFNKPFQASAPLGLSITKTENFFVIVLNWQLDISR